MSLLVWLPLNGNLNNNGLGTVTMSGTPSYLGGKLSAQAYDLSKRCTFTVSEFVGLKTMSMAFWYLVNADNNLSSDWVDLFGFKERQSDDSATGDFRFETCYGSSKNSVALGQYSGKLFSSFGTITATKGAWHHVCVTIDYENNLCTCYFDGVKKSTKTHKGGWCLGNFWLGQANAINGALQDLRLYDHALSVKEVKELAKGMIIHYDLKGTGVNPNLQPNSQTFGTTTGNPNNFTHETKTYDGQKVIRMTCKTDNYSGGPYRAGFTKTSLAVVGKTYTWSMYIRANTTFTMTTVGHECGGTRSVTVTPEWQYVTKTWTVTDGTYTAWVFYGRTWALGDWIEVKNFKVEEGSIATPYIPNTAEAIYNTLGYNSTLEEDLSGHGFNGTRTNVTYVSGSPKYNMCTYFDENDYISLGDTPGYIINKGNPFSFSVWVRSLEDNTRGIIFSSYQLPSTSDFVSFELHPRSNNAQSFRFDWKNGAIDHYTDGTFDLDTWTHIACTCDGSTAKVYKNGALKDTFSVSLVEVTAGNTWYIGRDGRTGSTAFNGYMSDFRLYATALSAEDVKELYQVSAQIDKSGNFYCGQLVEV